MSLQIIGVEVETTSFFDSLQEKLFISSSINLTPQVYILTTKTSAEKESSFAVQKRKNYEKFHENKPFVKIFYTKPPEKIDKLINFSVSSKTTSFFNECCDLLTAILRSFDKKN